ncbi:hypothetical protein [Wenzhouxiangella sediminis]|uniref:Uncharacterized protein n=1 Tax=Wenzhouxiangella sediminis TaxID=1792836 RepID=A0A3E1K769_9GAMM|nr:hypothetical protein [Wenzhouxiangella sediminis]RFF29875.1 hypothetical protein DZC52_10550 [Wenzhouxiangella sediminis]
MAYVGRIGRRAAVVAIVWLLPVLSEAGQTFELGILSDPASAIEARSQWDWAIRGSSLGFSALGESASRLDAPRMPLIVLEDACLPDEAFERLEAWVESGGLLIINGLQCRGGPATEQSLQRRARLVGLSLAADDPGLLGVYPRVSSNTPLLVPFDAGDGIRFGRTGIARTTRLQAGSATVLARGYRIEPGPGDWVRRSDAVTIASRRLGEGRIVFLNFSLAEIAACHPGSEGEPTDCSGAGTARALMRYLLANLFWEERGVQIPLRWETPGNRPLGVVLTGDVHPSDDAYQVRSARLMAERIAGPESPLTYFVVGDVARLSSEHFEALRGMPGVVLGTHSAQGRKYIARDLSGAESVHEDIRASESLLGVPSRDEGRRWRVGVRSHGWASDHPAWRAMERAGVSVVFDHNADAVLPEVEASAPREWFRSDVSRRLFVPTLERSVHTEADDFVGRGDLEESIFSLGSPEPDPCCNWAVTFDAYTEYVADWHEQFLKLGAMGGATAVWLWHPSTPVWKGGLDGLERFVDELAADDRTSLFSAHELATWAYNRERVHAIPKWTASGRLNGLSVQVDAEALAPLPPSASEAAGTVSYWVLGQAEPEGWHARQTRDSLGRVVTVLSRRVPPGDREP